MIFMFVYHDFFCYQDPGSGSGSKTQNNTCINLMKNHKLFNRYYNIDGKNQEKSLEFNQI